MTSVRCEGTDKLRCTQEKSTISESEIEPARSLSTQSLMCAREVLMDRQERIR